MRLQVGRQAISCLLLESVDSSPLGHWNQQALFTVMLAVILAAIGGY